MKTENKINGEIALYTLLFLAALALRLLKLGQAPLLESEAFWAMQAWRLAQGEVIPVGSQVGYLSITEAIFSFFGSGSFQARLWPAFTGSLIIWLPLLLRKDFKRIPALILAAGLALDPALVPVSRLAGSLMPALVFLALAAGSFHAGMLPWSMVFVVLGLFSGPGFWLGVLLLGMGLLAGSLLGLFDPGAYFRDRLGHFKRGDGRWPVSLLPALLVWLVLGTFFLGYFQGLSAWAGALPEFIRSWIKPSGFGLVKFLVHFILAHPLALLFGLLGFIKSWQSGDRWGKLLSIYFAVVLVLLLIYPQRQAEDMIWLAVPLWASAAAEIWRLWSLARNTWVTWAMSGLVVVLASLNWLTLIGMIFQSGNDNALLLELGLLAASLALLVLTAAIVSSEWGWPTAWKGLAHGCLAALMLYMAAGLSLDAYLMEKDPRSIYSGGAGGGQMALLVDSIADASITATGRPDAIQGAVVGGGEALRWELRGFEGMDYFVSVPASLEYPILITTGEGNLQAVQDNFRGQDFVLNSRPGWGRILPDDWISWIAFREGPVVPEHLILWIRNDIYSGY